MKDEINPGSETERSAGVIPFTVSVGVTGHRILPDSDQIAERIREIFRGRFLECFDEEAASALRDVRATPVTFTVVTPLAPGADQLVARIALEHGARLEAVLPFAEEKYLENFEPDPRVHFKDLLQRATRCITLKNHVKTGAAEERDEAYLKVGQHVVDHCDLLIAIWDEEPPRGKGGTAEIVALALAQSKPTFIISTTPPHEATLHHGGQLQARGLRQIEEFNAHWLDPAEIRKRSAEEMAQMYNDPCCDDIPKLLRQMVAERLLPCYARASLVAEANQQRYQKAARNGYRITTCSVAILAIAVVWHAKWFAPFLFLLESALLLYLYRMVHRTNQEQVHKKWLEHRSLAEKLRIALIFASCGVPLMLYDSRRLLIDVESKDFVSTAFEAVLEDLPDMPVPADRMCSPFGKYICTGWIRSQKEYHERKAQIAERRNVLLKEGRNVVFLLALIMSVSHLLIGAPEVITNTLVKEVLALPHQLHDLFEKIISVIAITLPAASAALEGFRTLMEYERIASGSNAMKTHLDQLLTQAGKLSSHRELAALLARTEKLMLIESQDWIKLMRFADLEKVI